MATIHFTIRSSILFIAPTRTRREKGKLLAMTVGQEVNTGHGSPVHNRPRAPRAVLEAQVRVWKGGGMKQANTAKNECALSRFSGGNVVLPTKCLQFLDTFSASTPISPLEIESREKVMHVIRELATQTRAG